MQRNLDGEIMQTTNLFERVVPKAHATYVFLFTGDVILSLLSNFNFHRCRIQWFGEEMTYFLYAQSEILFNEFSLN